MNDESLIAKLRECDAAHDLDGMRNLLKAEGGMSRVIGLLPKPKAPAKPKSTAPGTPIPEGWKPSPRSAELALAQWQREGRPDLSVETETEKFIGNHLGRGTLSKNWAASWQTWYCNAPNMTPAPRNGVGRPALMVVAGGQDTDERGWAERMAAFEGRRGQAAGYWLESWGPRPGEPGAHFPPKNGTLL